MFFVQKVQQYLMKENQIIYINSKNNIFNSILIK